jgi:hypothetical protein
VKPAHCNSAYSVSRAVAKQSVSLLILGVLFSELSVRAQYSIDWFKVAGGGGTSVGTGYTVSSTIGQPDSGLIMTNGQYSIAGGFWVLPQPVQVTGAPFLTINSAAPGNAIIAWTPNTPGFVLQETWTLSPANWTNSSSGSTNPATISIAGAAKFFRLHKL